MTAEEYQLELYGRLQVKFEEVHWEWYAFAGQGRLKYSPAVDLAIGPINDETKDAKEMQGTYDVLLEKKYFCL